MSEYYEENGDVYFIGFHVLHIGLLSNRQPAANEQKTWLWKANQHEKNGWIYLHIEESPEERGFQHGYLLAKEIQESIRILQLIYCNWKHDG